MIKLRFRTEWSENLKLVLIFWMILGLIAWSVTRWWFGSVEIGNSGEAVAGFSMLGAGAVVFFLVSTMFKRDDLKHPQDFWTTRPIRSLPLFGTKFLFVLVTIVLPVGLLVAGCGLATGLGSELVWHAFEAMLWMTCFTLLLALSCMAFPGGGLSFVCVGLFVGGIILTSIFFAYAPALGFGPAGYLGSSRIALNVLLVIVGLIALFGFLCFRLIRGKHFRLQPVILLFAGIMTTLIGGYAPIPGSIPGRHEQTMKEKVLKITSALEPDRRSFGYGYRNGACFVSQTFALDLGLPDIGPDCRVDHSHLEVVGEDTDLVKPEVDQISQTLDSEAGETYLTSALLTYTIFDRKPGGGGGRSTTSGGDISRRFHQLPKKKVRVTGWVQFRAPVFREIHRAPLGKTFSRRIDGMQFGFLESPAEVGIDRNSVFWKYYTPPLLTSAAHIGWNMIQYRVEHPSVNFPRGEFDSGGHGSGGPFGRINTRELRISNDEIRSSYSWSRVKDGDAELDVEQWKKEAELVFEMIDHVELYRVKVDVEIEVPDPDKAREVLNSGSL